MMAGYRNLCLVEGLFITEEVQSLLKKGVIVQVKDQSLDSKMLYSNLFTVPKKGGERRPIINLKALSRFIPHVHFKMEGIQSLRELILPGDFMIKLDLKDAYFSIPIHTTQQRFLSFMWEGQSYQFTCLPFGLSSAPRTFTMVMKPLVAYLRSLGIRLVIYLDDMLILAQTKEELLKWRSIVLDLLENLGFLINYKKSEFEPTQSLIFLGFLINSVQMEISLPREKVSQAIQEAQNLLRSGPASARQLAHLIGVFTSTLPTILPAPLNYRGLQNLKHQILKRGGYDAILQLSDEAREDLVWWTENLPLVNGQPLVREQPSLQIESNTSLKVWGGHLRGGADRWSLGRGRETPPHKLPGAVDCFTYSPGFCQGQEGDSCPASPRQCNCSGIHQSHGGNEIPRASVLSNHSVGMVPTMSPFPGSIPYTRSVEHKSRPAVQVSG